MGHEWDLERLPQQRGAVMSGLKQLHVCGKAGRVRQQHPQGDMAAADVIAGGKIGKQLNQRPVQFELASIVQDHARRGGSDHLGDRGKVIDGLGAYGR